jgi:predicted nicotinamide N-methyase
LNAALNGVAIRTSVENRIGTAIEADLLLAGDVFFDREMAASIVPWFDTLAASGATILVGDPGRAYLPRARLTDLATYEVPVTRALEDAEVKRSTVWRWRHLD